ncbi:MFS transporter [Sphingomonas sp.]|uniref:MFS transporter n=1 Tax=Sphingomonas sp. TaxID=28214 RepID=UPI002CD10390|nr:MFS transporter [Sphingomonas sp.]HWK35093.1 MFS transporter [Sphingomonas sp.]
MVAVSFGTALVVIDGAIAAVALPTIARSLHVDNAAVVSIVTIYQLTLVMLLLPFAGLAERIGVKRMYQGGQALFAVATMLCFFAESLPFLLIVRTAQAIGAAGALSVTSAMVRAIYPRAMLGRGLGLNAVIVSSSAAAAPTVGGLILGIAPWPWVFASAVPFAIISLFLGRSLPDLPRRSEPFDVLGAVMCAATFGLVIGGLESAVHGDSPVVSGAIVVAGLGIGWFFVQREMHEAKPILPIDLLSRPVIALSAIGAFTAFLASQALLLSLPFRLQHSYGFSPSEVGAMIAPWPLTTLFVAPISGALSDRIPAGLLGGVGMTLAVTALVLLANLPPDPGYVDVAWRMSLCGAGFGMFLSPNARLVVGSSPRDRATAAGGLVSTIRMVGQTSGATLVAALLAMGIGAGPVPPYTAAALALIAGLCSVARLRPSIRNPQFGEAEGTQPASQVR